MARNRRKLKEKSNVRDSENLQRKGTTNKRKCNEVRDSQQVSNKRKRSRYNLQQSNSVVLVCETPCCQNPDQQEKYARLGLNSALFLSGSKCPRRKQSHISIITISSDDEETSEERTSEWVNNLDENQQRFGEPEPDHLSGNNECQLQEDTASTSEHLISHIDDSSQVRPEQNFHPMCTSTPCNTADVPPSSQYQSEELSKTEGFNCFTLVSIKSPKAYQPDKLNEAKASSSDSSSLFSKNHSNTRCISSENSKPVVQLEKLPQFHFGSLTDSVNSRVTPTYPFHYYFNNHMETPTPDGFKFPSTDVNMSGGLGISEINQEVYTGGTLETNTNRSTDREAESTTQNSEHGEIFSERNDY